MTNWEIPAIPCEWQDTNCNNWATTHITVHRCHTQLLCDTHADTYLKRIKNHFQPGRIPICQHCGKQFTNPNEFATANQL